MTTTIQFERPRNAEEWFRDLGDVPLHRIRMYPYPATEADALRISDTELLCELINGTLVEKAAGNPESFLNALLSSRLMEFVRSDRLGLLLGPDGPYRMKGGNIRMPDISFTLRNRITSPLPNIADWCPDLCIDFFKLDNTRAELDLKRRDYFASGCRLVWEIDRQRKLVTVYTSIVDPGTQTDTLDGGAVLPGFALPLAQLFAEFDAAMPPAAP